MAYSRKARTLLFICLFISFFLVGYTPFPYHPKKSGELYLRNAGILTVILDSKVPFFDRVDFEINGKKGEFTSYDSIGAKQSFRIEKVYKPVEYSFKYKGQERFTFLYQPFYVQFVMLRHIVNVNGYDKTIDVAPFFKDDEEMLPVRYVAEFMGGDVKWSNDRRMVTITFLNRKTVLYIDKRGAVFNGRKITLTTAPIIVKERTFLPISVVKNLFNLAVKNDRDVGIITIGGGQ